MNGVFLDTGYVLALELADDQNHRTAQAHWRALETLPPLMTTSYVFDEVATFFNARGLHRKAVEVGDRLSSSPSIQLLHVGEVLFRKGFDLLKARPDKRYSFTDCVSFVVMQERGIRIAFTFDRHFAQEGFEKRP